MADKKKRPPLIKVTTPEGIARFPWLNKPDTKFNADGDYSTGIVLTAEEAQPIIDLLNAEVEKAYLAAVADLTEKVEKEKGEKKAKAKKALDSIERGAIPAKPEYDDDGNETGNVILTFKMKATRKVDDGEGGKKTVKQAPKLFDANGDAIPNSVQVWGGSSISVAGSINGYYIPGTNTAGASLRLAAVQVIKLSSGNGGTAESFGFGKKDGYTAPAADSPADDDDDDRAGGSGSDDDDDF